MRTTRRLYGNIDNVDAFVGMVSEQHVPGTELVRCSLRSGSSSSRTFATGVAADTDATTAADVFTAPSR